MTGPMSSPFKVRERKLRVWAEDASGQTVVDGSTREHWPERYVATTPSGTCRVSAAVESGAVPYLPVLDASGREVARIVTERRKDWVLHLATGETAQVTKRGVGMLTPFACTIGELSSAVAPRFAPQRYFTLTVADAVLARPDRDALVTALTWISESTIAGQITANAGGD